MKRVVWVVEDDLEQGQGWEVCDSVFTRVWARTKKKRLETIYPNRKFRLVKYVPEVKK